MSLRAPGEGGGGVAGLAAPLWWPGRPPAAVNIAVHFLIAEKKRTNQERAEGRWGDGFA